MFIAMKELEGMLGSWFKKGLAVAVIVLFIGTSVVPSIVGVGGNNYP